MPEPTLEELLRQNDDAPTNDEFALAFARRLFTPLGERADDGRLRFDLSEGPVVLDAADDEDVQWCGEPTRGLLEAVLASDLLSEAATNRIEAMAADAAPALERTKTIGHFRFHWTEDSPDDRDNTNEANIDATGAHLNDCWARFVQDFRPPKASLIGGVRLVDIDVHFDPRLHGSTSSVRNRIFLNSHTVVNDPCRRRTTSAHELFHRVEYSYGYITGTPGQKWWVEALGSWSQEYFAPDVNDYVTRVNAGLSNPENPLLDRSYDACHYWKYLGEQVAAAGGGAATEHEAVAEALERYAANGLDMREAAGHITDAHLGRSFDRFFQDWSKANYLKDLDRPSDKYDYAEDDQVKRSCNRTYGPYRHVAPDSATTIEANATTWSSGTRTVAAYGTRYHHFDIDPSVTETEVRFEGNVGGGSGVYSVHIALIEGDRWRRIFNHPSASEMSRLLTMEAGEYDRCVVIVNGLGRGGPYELSLNSCLTGTWRDGFNFVWQLQQAGDDVTGTVATSGCGTYGVTGTITGDEVRLQATGDCSDFGYEGTVDDCRVVQGTWTSENGGSGSFEMARIEPGDADLVLADESEEWAIDPTTLDAGG